MAARVMGVYTSKEGIAVAVCLGKRVTHVSWHPSFTQPDGTSLYPAEEIHRIVTSQTPDGTVAFDTETPVAALPVALPRLRPRQVFQALEIELASRSIDELLSPVVGFCPGMAGRHRGQKGGHAGFALAVSADDLKDLRGRYRPFGIAPTLLTLPIFPLMFAFMQEVGKDPALLFLVEGEIFMVGVVREGRLHDLEIFYGDESVLEERLQRHLSRVPDLAVYGFEAVSPRGDPSPRLPSWTDLFRPLESGQDAQGLIQRRRSLSRDVLAILLSQLPAWLGTAVYGGVRLDGVSGREKAGFGALGYAAALLVLLLLGAGAVLATWCRADRQIAQSQKKAMSRLVKTVLPHAPPVATTELVKSQLLKVKRIRKHLAPFLAPSALRVPILVLPILDEKGGIEVREIDARAGGTTIVFESAAPIDVKPFEERLEKALEGGKITIGRAGAQSGNSGKPIYTLEVEEREGARRAQ